MGLFHQVREEVAIKICNKSNRAFSAIIVKLNCTDSTRAKPSLIASTLE